MLDPRKLKTILAMAKGLGLTELELEHDGLHVKASFPVSQEISVPEVRTAVLPTKVAEELSKRKAIQEQRPVIASLSEKSPFFDFGLKT